MSVADDQSLGVRQVRAGVGKQQGIAGEVSDTQHHETGAVLSN